MIQKKSGFIISAGRTGTTFFAKYLSQFPEVYAVHEPDTIKKPYRRNNWRAISRDFGLFNFIIRKLSGKWGSRALSIEALSQDGIDDEIIEAFLDARQMFVGSKKEEIYIESNLNLFGLIRYIPKVFSNYKILYIVRDPRTWVPSMLNKTELKLMSKNNPVVRLNLRLSPQHTGEADIIAKWKEMDEFEKSCWYCSKVNSIMYNDAKHTDNVMIARYEDLFHQDPDPMTKAISHLLSFDGISTKPDREEIENKLKKRVNASKDILVDSWQNWDASKCKTLHHYCKDIMDVFQYGTEDIWRKRVL